MSRRFFKWLLIGAIGLTSALSFAKTPGYSPAVKQASPSVVSIQAERQIQAQLPPVLSDPFFKYFFESPQMDLQHLPTVRALGSGVIVSKDGHILTNYHVIKDTQELSVKLPDGREFTGKVIASDPPSDLGIVKIDGVNLPVALIGDSESLEVGDIVLAIGNPFGVGQTVTQGIVSALERKNLGLNLYEGYIQTDAAINPGNSGGALIDADGKLIGINTAILSRSGGNNGIGFAIPISYAQQIMTELLATGQVERGWIGLVMADLNKDIRESFGYDGKGVLVRAVYARSPAAEAGILPGDIIISANKKTMTYSGDLRELVTSSKAKDKMILTVMRNKKEMTFALIVGRRDPNELP